MDVSYLKNSQGCSIEGLDECNFVEFFAEYKRRKLERPDLMIKLGMAASARGGDGVDPNVLDEALFNAGVDVGDNQLAQKCLARLKKQFPDSVRVGVLEGKYLESTGQHVKALALYYKLKEQNMASLPVMKRIVCVYKAQGKIEDAVEALHTILKTFPNEPSCWYELSEMYLNAGEYDKAAHCCEELVLIDPNAAMNHNRLADAYYSLGCSKGTALDADSLKLARQHYTHSLEREGPVHNLHALYGLAAAAQALQEVDLHTAAKTTSSSGAGKEAKVNEKGSAHDRAVNKELLLYAKEKLQQAKLEFI